VLAEADVADGADEVASHRIEGIIIIIIIIIK
jgi:hypothetical protein